MNIKNMKGKIRTAIVEDDVFYGEMIKKAVENFFENYTYKFDLELKHYLGAPEFLEDLNHDKLEIILMDYYLENDESEIVISGLELLEAVRNYCPDSYVVTISTVTDKGIVDQLREGGVYSHITKEGKVLERLNTVLKEICEELTAPEYKTNENKLKI